MNHLFTLRRWQRWVYASLLGWVHLVASPSLASAQTLTYESWRYEDMHVWTHHILPVLKTSPVQLELLSEQDPAKFDAGLLDRLRQGKAGDLIACRPFDRSLDLYDQGYLLDITDMPELRRFRRQSKLAWTTYYNDRVFCMPAASVMAGFFYNKAIFDELKLSPPKTEAELWSVLDAVAASGKYEPLAYGTQDRWQASEVLFSGIGPNHWKGDQGRLNLLFGRAQFTDPEYVQAWRTMQKLGRYLPKQHATINGYDARAMFLSGRAAIYPAGSWEIRFMENQPGLQVGVFAPPPPSDQHNCFVLNHFDQGIGINANSPRVEEARSFLRWLSTQEFASAMAKHLHGFFPLSNYPVRAESDLGNEMIGWAQQCDTSIRINSQYLNQAWPGLADALADMSTKVMTQEVTPEEAAKHISEGVKKWFKPI